MLAAEPARMDGRVGLPRLFSSQSKAAVFLNELYAGMDPFFVLELAVVPDVPV